jgi:PAS domain S-box-containing protein
MPLPDQSRSFVSPERRSTLASLNFRSGLLRRDTAAHTWRFGASSAIDLLIPVLYTDIMATNKEAKQPAAALQIILSTVLDAVVAVNGEGVVIAWNGVAETIFGWTTDEAVGCDLNDLIVPHVHRSAHGSGLRRAHLTGHASVLGRVIELTALHKNGREFPIELSITRPPAQTGAAFIGFIRDISARHAADKELRDAYKRIEVEARGREAILSQLGEAVILADADGKLTFVNEAAERLHGVRLLGVGPEDYTQSYHLLTEDGLPHPPADLPLARAVKGETVSEARWLIKRPDGSVALAVGNAKPVLDKDGKQVGSILTARDETERDKAERQVRESEARLRALTDNLPGGAVYQVRMNADGSDRAFVYLSQSYERLAGVPVAEVLADPSRAYDAIDFQHHEEFARAEQKAIATRSAFDVQARFRHANGKLIWCRFISAPREQPDGSIIWDGLQIDVTARIQAEIALRDLNTALEQRVQEEVTARERVWSVTRDLFVLIDVDGAYRKLNPAWQTEMGYEPGKLIGTRFDDLVHPDDLETARVEFARLQTGEPVADVDIRIRAPDGSYRSYSWTCTPEAEGIWVSGRDLTRRKELEEQLRQSQKMEAVGQLTGGIAHDFNNLLTIIGSAADMMRRREITDERRSRYVEAIAETVERASKLTSQLLAFARRQPLKPEIVDATTQVPIVMELVRPLLGSRIDIQVAGTDRPLFTRVDVSQFETAVMNLLLNARDAMEGEGRIRITISEVGTLPALRGELGREGDFLRITISDSGKGISPDQISQVFEPFYTTKEVGRGTGLGLSQVYGFARQSGGDVEVRSRLGDGASFSIYLPKITSQVEAASESARENSYAAAKGMRVLVVEDDERVGEFSAETLRDLGHEPVLVRSGAEALELLAQDDLRFDVIFSDVLMAGMTGLELAKKLREQYPGLPVLLTSGYSDVIAKEGSFGFPLLKKPYSVEALSRALRKAAQA